MTRLDKRGAIPCFICLYRRSYPLDRRIIGKTDNNQTRDITVNELQLLIARDFRKLEFMSFMPKREMYIGYDYELKYLILVRFLFILGIKISLIEFYMI